MNRDCQGGCPNAALTVAIPTYGRDQILVDSARQVLEQDPAAREVLILDQTPRHEPEVEGRLAAWDSAGSIRWLRLPAPSITGAMNTALKAATCPIVLFLDDDVSLAPGLVAAHAQCFEDDAVWAVAGQVLQPGEEPEPARTSRGRNGLWRGYDFPFNSTQPAEVHNVMAGNLSVRRDRALEVGGFDENFIRVAYRFETDFARRIWDAGGRIRFEPQASIRHLRAPSGGTRTYIDHRRSHRPDHSVGDYYYALRHGGPCERWTYSAHRMVRSVLTKYHLRRPWWIVPKLIGELRGLGMAMRLARQGPRLLTVQQHEF